MSISERLAGLDAIGVGSDGGVTRLAWTPEDAACRAWFAAQAQELGLSTRTDPAGNLWACPDAPPPWWGTGSHLDSVRAGGRYDGPLGVACGFEVAAASDKPVAVLALADEEGARFNTPTFGSKALTGGLDLPDLLERRDGEGITLAQALRAAGVDPDRLTEAPEWRQNLAGFIEVHIDQTRELARAGRPVGLVSALASRLRLEVDLRGRADHAGTTPRPERRDALSAAAHLIVAAEELAAGFEELTVTSSRMVIEPNAPTTIAAHVRLWIDARSPRSAEIDAWLTELRRSAQTGAVEASLTVASRSDGREFAPHLRAGLSQAGHSVTGQSLPEVVCFAGHDAGVLAEQLPAAMVLVRNPTGVSHSPQEDIDPRDAEVAVSVVAQALDDIA